jgi:hypothetical protein
MKFSGLTEFTENFTNFWQQVQDGCFAPRAYIMENLTLEKCAQRYLDIVEANQ